MEHEQLLPLLKKVSKEDRSAFEELYNVTRRQLYAVALRMLQNKESAEEALQEAYVKIWYKADSYKEGQGTVLTWMVSILRYRVIDMLRHNKVRRSDMIDSIDFDDVPSESVQSDDNSDSLTSNKQIDKCMEELDMQQRQAIHLAYFNGLSHSEVVSHLGSPLGTIKSWIRRGLASLQRCLAL